MVVDIYFKIVRPKYNFLTDSRTGSNHHQWMSFILKSPNDNVRTKLIVFLSAETTFVVPYCRSFI